MTNPIAKPRLLAIASGGGHWEQLMLMKNALGDFDVHYITTIPELPRRAGLLHASIVPDCNRNEALLSLKCLLQVAWVLLRFRPKVVLSTGALPGVIGLMVGKALGARTVWIDSVANAEEFSMSGRLAKRFADKWLSQWRHVAEREGASFIGGVL